jgi:hypothetical protein
MRLRPELLMAGLLTATLFEPASAQDTDEMPIGGRVQMSDVGVALTLPEGWLFETSPATAPAPGDASTTSSMVLQAEERVERVSERGTCWLHYTHVNDPAWWGIFTLDDYVHIVARSMPYSQEGYAGSHETTPLELPIGAAIRVDLRPGDPVWPDELDTYYFYAAPDGFYSLNCWSLVGPDDRWLSIAKTLEFLPDRADRDAPASPDLDEATGPVVRGGRIEVPAAGFALEVPEDWYGFDLTHPELLAEAASFDAAAAMLGPRVRAAIVEAAAISDALDVPLVACQFSRAPHGCDVMTAELAMSVTADALVDQHISSAEERGIVFATGPEVIMLPAGPATVIYGEPGESSDSSRSLAAYFIEAEPIFIVYCVGEWPPEDRWLSIAETFEFLPVEEDE